MIRRGEEVPDDIKKMVLDLMIEGELLYLAGLDLKIDDLDGKVDTETRQLIEEFPSERAFADNLALRGMTVAMLKEDLKRRVIIDHVLEREVFGRIKITDEEIEEYYNNAGTFQSPLQESREEIIKILSASRTPVLLDELIERLKKKYPVEKMRTDSNQYSSGKEKIEGKE